MESIYLSGAVADAPTVPSDVSAGHPTDGSSGGGISATVPGAQWYDGVTMEIVNAIKGGNITPDRNQQDQLNQSIDARMASVAAKLDAAVATLQAKVQQVEVTPPGMIMYYPKNSAPNANWLVCDGRAVSRTGYAALFAVIGTQYGAGNGSTTFNVPYLIDRVAWGGVGNVGEYRQPGLPNITGTFDGNADDGQGWKTGAFYLSGSSSGANGDGKAGSGVIAFDASRSNGIYGRSNTVQPPALVLLPCIHI
nr:MAG TPA: tail collar fiber protein [Caudoviricetes sp.]